MFWKLYRMKRASALTFLTTPCRHQPGFTLGKGTRSPGFMGDRTPNRARATVTTHQGSSRRGPSQRHHREARCWLGSSVHRHEPYKGKTKNRARTGRKDANPTRGTPLGQSGLAAETLHRHFQTRECRHLPTGPKSASHSPRCRPFLPLLHVKGSARGR